MSEVFIPTIIDVEASGFGNGSYPIEIGIALPDGKTDCYLVKPHVDWNHWDETGEEVHGISRELLAEKGKPIAYVADKLNSILRDKTVYSDAWGFDSTWIALLFHTAEIPQAFRVAQLQGLFQEEHYELWHATLDQIQAGLGIHRHRASSDAYLIQQAFIKTSLAINGQC